MQKSNDLPICHALKNMISPPICRGLTTLERELFHKSLEVVGIRVPVNSIAKFVKALNKLVEHGYMLYRNIVVCIMADSMIC